MAGGEDLGRIDVCAVVVTHRPPADFAVRVARLRRQVERLLVVDDGTPGPELAPVMDTVGTFDGVELLRDTENRGLAAALNRGVRHAATLGYGWVLLLDQDSVPTPVLLTRILEAYHAHPRRARLAVIGAGYRSPLSGPVRGARDPVVHHRDGAAGAPWVERTTVITSGSLVPVRVFRELGGFREEFFIDHVDDEFCLRARREGYEVVMTATPAMEHAPGRETRHAVLGRRAVTPNQPPWRRYYRARNFMVLVREYARREPWWILRGVREHVMEALLVVLFEDDAVAKLGAMLQGVLDGLRGQLGPRRRTRRREAA